MERSLEHTDAGASVRTSPSMSAPPDDFAAVLLRELAIVAAERDQLRSPAFDQPRCRSATHEGMAATTGARRADGVRRAHEDDLVGLAFSGGGIRSATFHLGVLQ